MNQDIVHDIPEAKKRSPVFLAHSTFLRVAAAIGTNASPVALCNVNNLPRAPVGALGKLFLCVKEIMEYSNELKKVKVILAQIVEAHRMGDRDAIKDKPTMDNLEKAKTLLYIVTAPQVSAAVKTKLTALDPQYEGGIWVCTGRLRKSLRTLIG